MPDGSHRPRDERLMSANGTSGLFVGGDVVARLTEHKYSPRKEDPGRRRSERLESINKRLVDGRS